MSTTKIFTSLTRSASSLATWQRTLLIEDPDPNSVDPDNPDMLEGHDWLDYSDWIRTSNRRYTELLHFR